MNFEVKYIDEHIGQYFQHKYGGIYQYCGTATSTVDFSQWVYFYHCWPHDPKMWIRPCKEFWDGRFTEIRKEEAHAIIMGARGSREEWINKIMAAQKAANQLVMLDPQLG